MADKEFETGTATDIKVGEGSVGLLKRVHGRRRSPIPIGLRMSRGQTGFLVVIGLRSQPRCTSTGFRYHAVISMGCRSMERGRRRDRRSGSRSMKMTKIRFQECRSWQNPVMH